MQYWNSPAARPISLATFLIAEYGSQIKVFRAWVDHSYVFRQFGLSGYKRSLVRLICFFSQLKDNCQRNSCNLNIMINRTHLVILLTNVFLLSLIHI